MEENIERKRKIGLIAKEVKIADLHDNLDLTRLPGELTDKDLKRIKKYKDALLYLLEE